MSHVFYEDFIILKVISTLKLCDIQVFGTTISENNKNVTTYHLQKIENTNKHEATFHYKITGLEPTTNFIFTVNIIDSLNNTKNQEQIIFSELTFYKIEQQ